MAPSTSQTTAPVQTNGRPLRIILPYVNIEIVYTCVLNITGFLQVLILVW